MNTIGQTSPKKPGWYWWRVAPEAQPSSILISESDITNNKFKNFGGHWFLYPTFDEVIERRKAHDELCRKVSDNEKKLVEFLESISTRTFTPKKEIKEFLASLPKTST